MTEIVDLRYLAESQPSLCIPRVFNNITESRIRDAFNDLNIGKISRIDIKERKNEKGDSFKRVYVHFEKWYWNPDAQHARRKLVSGKEIKIVYDNPWFWKVSASKWCPPPEPSERTDINRSKARIDDPDLDEFGRNKSLRRNYNQCSNQCSNKGFSNDVRNYDSKPIRRNYDAKNSVKNVPAPAPTPVPVRVDNPDHLTPKVHTPINYGNIIPPLRKKKQKPTTQKMEETPAEELLGIEDAFANIGIVDKEISDDLYGDLN